MTRLRSARIVLIAIGFIGSARVLSCFAAAPAPQQDSSYELSPGVGFELGTTYLQGGDGITIDAVRGTADTLSVGHLYQVQGTYKLASQEPALLALSVTTNRIAFERFNSEFTPAKDDGRERRRPFQHGGRRQPACQLLSCTERRFLCRRLLRNCQLHLSEPAKEQNGSDRVNAQ